MARFRLWLRSHVLNFLRDPDRKSHPQKTTSFRKSIMISAPVPIGSLAIDLPTNPPLPPSYSTHDLTTPHPLRQSRPMSADALVPNSISMIVEADEPLELPPTSLPDISERYSEESEEATVHESSAPTTRRPTRNFSRRFSSRFSSFSGHSVSSYGSSEAKRMSQMSAVSALSRGDSAEEYGEGEGSRLSWRWSNRMGGLTPLGVV
ncbi:Nn.00g006180.m01.CDS01 [Neocucurbitaria sp. VM-36]